MVVGITPCEFDATMNAESSFNECDLIRTLRMLMNSFEHLSEAAYTPHPSAQVAKMGKYEGSKVAWLGPEIKVKNTFICMDLLQSEDELMRHQVTRRRAVKSCPFRVVSVYGPRGSSPRCHAEASDENNGMQLLEHMSALIGDNQMELISHETIGSSTDSSPKHRTRTSSATTKNVPPQMEKSHHKRTSTREISLLQQLLEDETPSAPLTVGFGEGEPVQKLVLTSVRNESHSLMEFMIDEPTPTAFREMSRVNDQAACETDFLGVGLATSHLRGQTTTEDVSKMQAGSKVISSIAEHPGVACAQPMSVDIAEIKDCSHSSPSLGELDIVADSSTSPPALQWPKCCRYSSEVRKHCKPLVGGEAASVPAPLRWPTCCRFPDDLRKDLVECMRR
jgi:hypothetical protein